MVVHATVIPRAAVARAEPSTRTLRLLLGLQVEENMKNGLKF